MADAQTVGTNIVGYPARAIDTRPIHDALDSFFKLTDAASQEAEYAYSRAKDELAHMDALLKREADKLKAILEKPGQNAAFERAVKGD